MTDQPQHQRSTEGETRTTTLLDSDEPDAAHIVTEADKLRSQLTGEAVEALCGKRWVPRRNPDGFPLCQACVEIMNFRDQVGW